MLISMMVRLRSLRRRSLMTFCVTGLVVVLCCFIWTENYFMKQERIQTVQSKTNRNLNQLDPQTMYGKLPVTSLDRSTNDYDGMARMSGESQSSAGSDGAAFDLGKRNGWMETRHAIESGNILTAANHMVENGKRMIPQATRNSGVDGESVKQQQMNGQGIDIDITRAMQSTVMNGVPHVEHGKINPGFVEVEKTTMVRTWEKDRNIGGEEQMEGGITIDGDKNVTRFNALNDGEMKVIATGNERKDDAKDIGAIEHHQAVEGDGRKTNTLQDAEIPIPMDAKEKMKAHKNTFQHAEYQNTRAVQDFLQRMKDLAANNNVELDKINMIEKNGVPQNLEEAKQLLREITQQEDGGKKNDDKMRKYSNNAYRRKSIFRKMSREPKSVLKKVNWQPHFDTHNYTYLIRPDKNCVGHDGQYRDITLVVLVLTGPEHFAKRRVIRHTWLSYSIKEKLDMKTIFLLGATNNTMVQRYIRNEARMYQDILQEDFRDTYVNLTLKTIMGLKWSSQFCPNAKFVMKVDDDVAVNVGHLVAYLNALNITADFIGGIVTTGAAPYRQPNKKWYVPEEIYPDPTYPPYPQGKSYIMSMDVAQRLFEVSSKLHIFPWEDVFIGLCLKEIGLTLQPIEGFDGYQTVFSQRGELRKTNESLTALMKLLIAFDLNEGQMDIVWHVWQTGQWPKDRTISGRRYVN